MKRSLALIALGLLGPIVQGAVVPFLPRGGCPDAGLLFVIAVGLALRGATAGVSLAALVGFVADLLSGSLLGAHAFLWIFAFGITRMMSAHVNLRGAFTQMALSAALTAFTAGGLAALTAFFGSARIETIVSPGVLLLQAGVNALVAPLAIALIGRAIAWLGDDERRVLRIEPRSYAR